MVVLKDVERFDDILAATLDAGVNVIHGLSFQNTQLRRHRDKARELALISAREKAVAMSKTLGVNIDKVLHIRENHNNWSYGHSSWWGGASRWSRQTQNTVQNLGGGESGSDNIALGQVSISASVSVEFGLK